MDGVWQCDLRERTLSYDHTINQRHPHAVSLTIPPPPPCSCPLCRILGHDRPGWCYPTGRCRSWGRRRRLKGRGCTWLPGAPYTLCSRRGRGYCGHAATELRLLLEEKNKQHDHHRGLAGEVSQFRGDHLMQQRSSCTFASRSRDRGHHHHELASAEEARPLCLDVYSVRKMKWRIGLMPDILKRIRHQRATSFSRAVSSPE